jgi:uncharacterized protein (DUF2267 family)
MDERLLFIDNTVAKTYEWLREVRKRGDFKDLHDAYQAVRAVMHALRDRLDPNVAAHFSAQLPLLLRGVFYEGWVPARTPARASLEVFLARVEKEAGLKGTSAAEDAINAVMSVFEDELGAGTTSHLLSVLPSEYADLMWR